MMIGALLRLRSWWVCHALLGLALAGCNAGALVPVRGKVFYKGQPVTEGSLLFAPQDSAASASPATGLIQSDGSFALGTHQDGDGAAPGRHKVHYTAPAPVGPEWNGYGPRPKLTYSPFHGLAPKEQELEIKPGQADLTVELVPGPP